MNFLVQVSGNDLYIPSRECNRGAMHYDSTEVPAVTVDVNLRRPLLHYLKKLIEQLTDITNTTGQYRDRVNVLYEHEGDTLDLGIPELVRQPKFDIFVQGNQRDPKDPSWRYPFSQDYFTINDTTRFRYIHGAILLGDERLTRRKLVRDVFNQAFELQACYISSPNLEIPRYMDDFDAVKKWESHKDDKLRAEIDRRMSGAGYVVDNGFPSPQILLALIDSDPTDVYGVIDRLKDGSDGLCPCFVEDYDEGTLESEVSRSLEYLIDQGLVKRESGEFSIVRSTKDAPKKN